MSIAGDTPRGGIFQPLAWVTPYALDWGACGPHLTIARAYTTAIRWWDSPQERHGMVGAMQTYLPKGGDTFTGQRLLNVTDLMDSEVACSPALDQAAFSRFLSSLDDGDLITGGPRDDSVPDFVWDVRPGFAYCLSRWRRQFPDQPQPWPFWIFPRTGLTVIA